MDTIYRFTWTDNTGAHSATTVGTAERNDQWEYLAILQAAGTIWDVDYTVEGKGHMTFEDKIEKVKGLLDILIAQNLIYAIKYGEK